MNFDINTQRLGFCETVYETAAEQSLDADISLPDYCPEIQRVLKCSVVPNITSVQNNSGRITADCNAVVRLLYVGDNGKISGYEQSYPVQKFVESSRVGSDCAISANVNTDYVNCRAVNSRRIDVRAMMTFTFKAMKKREEDILCMADGAGIQTMTEDCNFASLSGVCERAFSIGEVVELGSEKQPVSRIINVSACAAAKEVKAINNKVLVKGDCTVKIYYIGEDSSAVESVEHSMPISQIIEMDGINEASLNCLNMCVSSCETVVKADSAGDMRLIDLNARISAFMAAFDETPVTLISDAYSTEYDAKNATKSIEQLKFNDSFDTSFTNKVVLESIGVSVDCVLAVWCSDIRHAFAVKEDKCIISGTYQATVMYKDSEGQTGIIQKPVDFEYTFKIKEKAERVTCFGGVHLSNCSCSVTGDSRIELKTEMLASGLVFSCTVKKYISSIEIDESCIKREKGCALTIYFCDKNESLWNIARRYNTTVEAIMRENDFDSETAEAGGMMLIPGV